MIITNSALARLVMINTGCRTFNDKKEENLKYLFRCVMTGRDFDIIKLEKNLPEESHMYSGIYAFSLSIGAGKIDVDVLYKFFGGKVHIDHVLDQIRATSKSGGFADKYLFAHMLTPVVLTSVSRNNITAKYVSNHATVDIFGLMVHPCVPIKLKAGDMVLAHYAVVVGMAENKICDYLFDEQESSQEFMEACQRISKIDYNSFWDLKNWTKNLISRCF